LARPSAARVAVSAMFRSASLSGPRNLRVLADEDLMQLVSDGEPRAFEALLDRHAGVAFSLAFRICGRRAMAEDVVREAFFCRCGATPPAITGRAAASAYGC
jgi:DNA-directed RNA polymerase specialized sigma24 family protein